MPPYPILLSAHAHLETFILHKGCQLSQCVVLDVNVVLPLCIPLFAFIGTQPLATTNSAPKLTELMCGTGLIALYLKLAPNAKLPPKNHENSLIMAHESVEGGIFQGRDALNPRLSAMKWSGHIRTAMNKWRILAGKRSNLHVLKRQAHE